MGNILLFALLGLLFFYIFKSYARYTSYSKEAFKNFSITKEAIEQSELGLFVALVAKVAKVDGRVDALEAELIGIMFDDIAAIFPEPAKTKEILKTIFNEAKEQIGNTEEIAQKLARAIKNDKQKQHHFIAFLIQLTFVDGEVSKSEEEMLGVIAQALAVDPKLYHAIFDQFEKMMAQRVPKTSLQDAYALLGVSEQDDMESIKKAYRKLVREYHPDIIKSQGKDDDYMKEATEKTQAINEAYELIKASQKSHELK